MVEVDTGRGVDDGVLCAAFGECDDGCAAGLGFERGDAEVFELWLDEEFGASVVVAHLGIGFGVFKGDGWAGA